MGFGKGKGFTEIEYPRTYPGLRTIPVPTISTTVVEDHSGGGYTAAVTLTIPEPTISVEAVVV